MKLTRREALKLLAAGSLVAATPAVFAQAVQAAQTPDLAVITGNDPAKNVAAALDALGGIARFVKKGEVVVIKPNMGFGNAPEKATTTDPRVIRAVAQLALNAGAKRVMVVDHPCHRADIVLDVCGIKNAVKDLDNTYAFTYTREAMYKDVTLPKAKSLKKAAVMKDILEADCLINLPVAKSHGGAKVSFSMKNWMGAVYNRSAWHVSHNLHQAIADMATFIKPRLTLLDATRALVTGGPGGPGKIENLNTIVAGTDPVAIDTYAVGMAKWGGDGYKPTDIPYIVMAAEQGVGRMDIDKLNILKKAI